MGALLLLVAGGGLANWRDGAKALQTERDSLFQGVATPYRLAGREDAGVIRRRLVRLNSGVLAKAAANLTAAPGEPASVTLNLFDDLRYEASLTRVDRLPKGDVFVGAIPALAGSAVHLSISEGVLSGSVVSLEGGHSIRYVGGDLYLIQRIDQARMPAEAEPIRVAPSPQAMTGPQGPQAEDGSLIDLMVVYTAAARAAAGGTAAIVSLINLGVSETNTAYENSGVIQRLRLVQTAEVAYAETGDTTTDLDRLRATSDGFLDDVHALRDACSADLVSLIISTSFDGQCGMAYLMAGNDPGFAASAFDVVRRDCISPLYSFGHELGHLQGLNHAREDPTGPGAFDYSYGYKDPNRTFRTMMSYGCSGGSCPRILHFSNPEVTYLGLPTGISSTQANSADNVKSLNNTRVTAANFRVSLPACSYALSSGGQSFGATGGAGSVGLTTAGGCAWTASSGESWITITSGTSGTGSGSVSFAVASNEGPARTGTLTIAGQIFTVTQEAGCSYALSVTNQTVSAAGGAASVGLTTAAGCSWVAGSNVSWVTVTSSGSGAGAGSIDYEVAVNTGPQRTGTLSIGGQILTIVQQAGCTYQLSPTSETMPENGGTGSVSVSAGGGCEWTATSQASWITITSNATGSGNGTIGYSVASNGGPLRIGTLTVAGRVLAVTQAGSASSGLQFYPLASPIRLLDTRAGFAGCDAPGAKIPGGSSRTQFAAGRSCGGIQLPANARAITGNITTVESGGGFLTLYPSDVARPTVANSNYGANEILNNVFTVGLGGGDGAFKIHVTTDTDVVVDVTGYYAPPGAGGLYFHPLPRPVRLLDTRANFSACFAPGATLPGGAETMQQATGSCSGLQIPANAQAIVGNATTVNSQGTGYQYFTLFPADVLRPTVASSNYLAGQVMNGPFTVGLSSAGAFKIYPTTQTDLVIDVSGYYSSDAVDSNGPGLLYYPLAQPVRLLETRPGFSGCYATSAPLGADSTRLQPVRGVCQSQSLPETAGGIIGNATVVQPLTGGWLTFFPSDATRPTVAHSNYAPGQVFNRHFIVGLGGADGAFQIFTKAATHLVIDLSGYFAP